jgi:hypothetical protein
MSLTGDQWGVMNETGSYPGQPWLWLYQLWLIWRAPRSATPAEAAGPPQAVKEPAS